MSQLVFDERAARDIESIYLIGDAVRRRRLVRGALGARPGERVLDIGCGPGFYCLELSDEVGPTGSVLGVDSSAAMLELAARRCAERRHVELRLGDAGVLPVADAGFDAAISVQVLEYVDDVARALAELHRALRPGGRAVLWDIDWATVSMYSTDPAGTQRILDAWDEHLAHRSLPRTLVPLLRSAGFGEVHMEGHAFTAYQFDTDSYGPALLPFIAKFVAGRTGAAADEAQAWVAEQRELGEQGRFYFACTQFCVTAHKPQ